MNEKLKRPEIIRKSIKGAFVVFVAVGLQYIIAFATQIALARLLAPEHFGVLAFAAMVAMFFKNFSNIHGDKYIVREKEDIRRKLDNVFSLELILAIISLLFVLLLAPFIMQILGKPELSLFVQFLAFSFLHNPFSKPRCLFERELKFFKAKFPMVAAQIVSSIVAISLALLNYGVWSLMWWRASTLFIEAIIVWWIAPYRPRLKFDNEILKGIVRYGWPLLGSSVVVFFYWNIDYYIVGHLLGKEQLGYYWLAFQTSHYLLKAKSAIISVVFPAFSRAEHDKDIKKGFELLTKITAIIYLLPTLIILALGPPTIRLVFGEKWLPTTVPFQIFMVLTTLRALTSYWDPVFMAKGKTKILFRFAIVNAILIPLLGIPVTHRYGTSGMAMVVLMAIVLITPMAAWELKKILEVSYIRTLKGVASACLLTLVLSMCFIRLVKNIDNYLKYFSTAFAVTVIYGLLVFAFEMRDVKIFCKYVIKRSR